MTEKWGKLPPRKFMYPFLLLYLTPILRLFDIHSEPVAILGLIGAGVAEVAFFWVNRKNKWFWMLITGMVLLALGMVLLAR